MSAYYNENDPVAAEWLRNLIATGGGALPEPFASALHGFWRDADWLLCTDGKWRPVEPGTFPLADGIPNRVGRLRAYGNAIVPQVAAEVIKAYGGWAALRARGEG